MNDSLVSALLTGSVCRPQMWVCPGGPSLRRPEAHRDEWGTGTHGWRANAGRITKKPKGLKEGCNLFLFKVQNVSNDSPAIACD